MDLRLLIGDGQQSHIHYAMPARSATCEAIADCVGERRLKHLEEAHIVNQFKRIPT